MAVKKTVKTTDVNTSAKEETTSVNKDVDLSKQELLDMINFLNNKIKELSDSKNNAPVVAIAKMDRPCTLIHLYECNPMLPSTIKVNGNEIRFTKFGEKRTFRFAEMQDITSKYREWFERGIFTLGEDCDEFKDDFGIDISKMPMSVDKFNKIASLPMEEFESIIKGISENQALFVAKTWIDRYNAKKPGYDNLSKIKILNSKTKGFMKEFMSDILNED